MFKRVLLCAPPFPGAGKFAAQPHTGLGYLELMLIKNGITYDVFDMRLGYSVDDLKTKISDFKPDLIAFTLMTHHHKLAYNIISEIKSDMYKIVVGGPHISTFKQKVLEECIADFAIILEGEFAFIELCRKDKLSDIPGLIYRNNQDILMNPPGEFITDLDDIGFPKYEKFELDKYLTMEILIFTSRGCPYNCIYCPIKTVMGRTFRVRSPESIFEELKYWYGKGYTTFEVVDDNFTIDKSRVIKVCDLIINNGLKINLKCINGIRADRVDSELLRKMREAGFSYVAFGVEAGNDRVLKIIKKGTTIEKIESAIKIACDIGFDVGLFFMVGHPTETESDVGDSIKLALKYPVAHANFYNIIPFPGTELYDWITENKFFVIPPEKYLDGIQHYSDVPVFETPELPASKRKELLKRARSVSNQILINTLSRKLSKYGIAGNALAHLYYNTFIHGLVINNKLVKKLSLSISNLLKLNY